MQFHSLNTQILRGTDLLAIRINKQADFDSLLSQWSDCGDNTLALSNDVQTAFSRHFLTFLGDKGHFFRQDFERDSNVIEVFIGRLRKKMDPENTIKPIETLRGRGYRFALERGSSE